MEKIKYVNPKTGSTREASPALERRMRAAGYRPANANDIPKEQRDAEIKENREAAEEAHKAEIDTLNLQIKKAAAEGNKDDEKALKKQLAEVTKRGPAYTE